MHAGHEFVVVGAGGVASVGVAVVEDEESKIAAQGAGIDREGFSFFECGQSEEQFAAGGSFAGAGAVQGAVLTAGGIPLVGVGAAMAVDGYGRGLLGQEDVDGLLAVIAGASECVVASLVGAGVGAGFSALDAFLEVTVFAARDAGQAGGFLELVGELVGGGVVCSQCVDLQDVGEAGFDQGGACAGGVAEQGVLRGAIVFVERESGGCFGLR